MSIFAFIITEWILTIIPGVAFLIRFRWPGHREDPVMAWHVESWSVLAVVETLGLLAAGLGFRPAMWVYAIIYGAGAAVVWWRLWLLILSERNQRED